MLALCAALLLGIPYVPVSNDTIRYFRSNSPIVQASRVVNEKLGGMYSIHIDLEGESATEPRLLEYMDGLAAYVQGKSPYLINKSIGLHDFVLRLNQLLNGEYALPSRRQTVVQYLSLFSGNLQRFAYPDIYEATNARLSFYLNNGSKESITRVLADIQHYQGQNLPAGYRQIQSGYSLSVNTMNRLVVKEQIRSIILALLGVLLIVSLSFRSLRLGLLSCLPPALTLLLNLALMALLRIDLNISTALINSLVIGVGVDYSIHLISSYHSRASMREALKQVGPSICLNAFAVALGYATLLFSQFRSLGHFGGLSALSNISAAALTLLVLPMLLLGRFPQKESVV